MRDLHDEERMILEQRIAHMQMRGLRDEELAHELRARGYHVVERARARVFNDCFRADIFRYQKDAGFVESIRDILSQSLAKQLRYQGFVVFDERMDGKALVVRAQMMGIEPKEEFNAGQD